MAKNSVKQIEKDERKILDELSKNANKSVNEIAKTCGFSRQKVWRIIKNLEKNNTIWGYIAVTDEEKLERQSYIVLIKITNQPIEKKVIDRIVKRDMEEKANEIGVDIICSAYINGIYDWMICFEAADIKDAKKFCESLKREFSGFIQELSLLNRMFSIKKCGIENPEIDKLQGFFNL